MINGQFFRPKIIPRINLVESVRVFFHKHNRHKIKIIYLRFTKKNEQQQNKKKQKKAQSEEKIDAQKKRRRSTPEKA